MNFKLALTAIGAFLAGSYIQTKFDQTQIKKKLPEILREADSATWTRAFHSGWESCEENPTIRYKHYTEFKDSLEQR